MDKVFEDKYIEMQKNWWWFSGRRDLILKLIKDIKYTSVLEIGCGSGELSKYIKNYTGIDISKNSCKSIIGDAQKLPIKNNSFDLILLLDLLEHTDDKLVMEEVYRILKPDGNVIITVPGFMFLWSQHDIDNHHVKRYRRWEIPINNFKIRRFTYWNFILFPMMVLAKRKKSQLTVLPKIVNYILEKILKVENHLIISRKRLPFGVTILYVISKSI